MGDRCFLRITTTKGFAGQLAKHIYEEPGSGVEEDPGLISWEIEEANYGYWTELNEAAGSGIPFYGSHGAGCDYPDGMFASDGENYAERETSTDGELIVRYDSCPDVMAANVEAVEKFLKFEEACTASVWKLRDAERAASSEVGT